MYSRRSLPLYNRFVGSRAGGAGVGSGGGAMIGFGAAAAAGVATGGGVGVGLGLGLSGGPMMAGDSVPPARRNRILAFLAATFLYAIVLNREGGAGAYLGASPTTGGGGRGGRRPDPGLERAARKGLDAMLASRRALTATTWNVAAVNNNPFEYWLTVDDEPEYERLMVGVERFLDGREGRQHVGHASDSGAGNGNDDDDDGGLTGIGRHDVPVSDVFTDDMYRALEKKMESVGWPLVREHWESNFRNRKIVSGFLKDPELGSKRLASMPDRVTNTIHVVGSADDNGGGGGNAPACRPTVINMYGGDLSSLDKWYAEWEKFVFDTDLRVRDRDGTEKRTRVYQMLLPIKRSKYPDLTTEEERVSLPLQTLCCAIFDAILVHMMNTVSSPDVWQPIKSRIVDKLVKEKVPRTLRILENQYVSSDVIMLQEASLDLVDRARHGPLGRTHHIVTPSDLDTGRDQNSVLLLRKETFPGGHSGEVASKTVASFFPPSGGGDGDGKTGVPVAEGDILALTATDRDGVPYFMSSFHGDTNGLATVPVLDALLDARSSDSRLAAHLFLFGLDANTYDMTSTMTTNAVPSPKVTSGEGGVGRIGSDGNNGGGTNEKTTVTATTTTTKKKKTKQDVLEFGSHFRSLGLASCWGMTDDDAVQPTNYTTFNARTYLQPQLNKACRSSDKRVGGDVNPKDFILFHESDFVLARTWKDNTGDRTYVEGIAFPTLNFPSDHGIVTTELRPRGRSERERK